MKEELSSIKEKSIEQEKRLLSNNYVNNLEKQLIIFREEALRLYDRL